MFKYLLLVLLFFVGNVQEILGSTSVTSIQSKSESCGLPFGGDNIQRLSKPIFEFADGAFWDHAISRLLFVDRFGASVNVYDPGNGLTVTVKMHEFVGQEMSSIYKIKGGKQEYILAVNQTVYLLKLELNEWNVTYETKPIKKFLKDDELFTKSMSTPQGDLIIGTKPSDYQNDVFTLGSAKFLQLNLSSSTSKILDKGFDLTGGVCFNKHFTKMYTADVNMNKIWEYDYNLEKGPSNKKLLLDMATLRHVNWGNVTAITMDWDDQLYIAQIWAHQIIVYNPDEKEIIRMIAMPTSAINTLEWGGPSLDILFAGSEKGFPVEDPKREIGSGSMFAITGIGSKGWSRHPVSARQFLTKTDCD